MIITIIAILVLSLLLLLWGTNGLANALVKAIYFVGTAWI